MPSAYDVIREHADSTPDKLAILSQEDGTRSYEELALRSASLGRSYDRELKLELGERICVWMWNRPEWVEASLACAATGHPTVPANPEWTDAELEFVLRHSRTRAILCEPSLAERALELVGRVETLDHVISLPGAAGGATMHDDLVDAGPDDASGQMPDVPESIPGQLMYTSGTTTGRPKAVEFSREMTRNAIDYYEMFGVTAADRALFVTPLFHGNGNGGLFSAVRSGGSAVFQRRFSASRFWELVDRTRPTYLFTLAPIVNMLMGLPPSPFDRQHGMRVMIALGAAGAAGAIEERFGTPVIDWYGMTEAGMGTYTRLDEERRPGSAGRPFDGSAMCILRDDGSEAKPGELGEVCFRAAEIGFKGYVEDEAATAAAMDSQFFHTGDLGRFDADGYFYFVDRKKDVVRRAGENISSLEVENVLRAHPDLAEIAILGRPDPILGERMVAFAVPQPGATAPSAEALGAFAAGQLAAFKIPEEVYSIPELPRTATGKVQKFRLRQSLEDQGR